MLKQITLAVATMIVAYVPEGYEVRYRIWSAGNNIQKAKQR